MGKQFLLHEFKTDANIIRGCCRSLGFSRTVLFPICLEEKFTFQDRYQVLENGECPLYEFMGTNNEEQLVYTLITTRYITSNIDTSTQKCRIENFVLQKDFHEVLDEFLNGRTPERCLKNCAKTIDGEDFIFYTESGTYQLMVYQIFKDLHFMCKKYRTSHID